MKDANSWDRFTLRTADFGYEGANYPLKIDNEGPWTIYENGCELVFTNAKWGHMSLLEFLDTLRLKAMTSQSLSDRWWRPSTLQYHWYERNNEFYSDYYEFSQMPQLVMTYG